MPVYRNRTVLEIARGITAFLDLEAGLTRGRVPEAPRSRAPGPGVKTGGVGEQQGRARHEGGLNPENIIWIFGAGRTGSTWLANMMQEMPRTSFWNEPMVGQLFGNFYRKAQIGQRNSRNFVLNDPARAGWLPLVREFVLGSVALRFPSLGPEDHLVVKEPNSSMGAPLILEALPEGRMIFLIRDPRDVVASALDGAREGGWLYARKRGRQGEDSLADEDPDTFAGNRARQYLNNVSGAKSAFKAHLGPKILVKYEDLVTDTLGEMRRIYASLEIPVDENELVRVVEKHSWENIPEEEKGEGKKFRKATPGGWSEDLSPEQVEIVENVTAPLLEEFYPERRARG